MTQQGKGREDATGPTLAAIEGLDRESSERTAGARSATTGVSAAGSTEADSASFSAWVGRTIDERYRIDGLLGEGGMGAVLLAEHLKLAKKVALKVVLPQFAGVGELAERFAREAMASGQLDHPHVASALDYGTLPEGGAYLVMQFVRGASLRDVMDAHVGDWAYACEVGAQVADALSAAHARRIVHRDLKPENVMLEAREGEAGAIHVRVLDFGIASVVGDDPQAPTTTRKLTRVGAVLGTPGYMAPEQALGEVVDERADLYALGVVLWECITGKTLFQGNEVTEILTNQLTQVVEPLHVSCPGVPAELDALVSRLLSTRRDDRPTRAADVRDALRRLALARQLERVSHGSSEVDLGAIVGRVTRESTATGKVATTAPHATSSAPTTTPLGTIPGLAPATEPARLRRLVTLVAVAALALVVAGVFIGVRLAGGGDTAIAVPTPVPVPVPAGPQVLPPTASTTVEPAVVEPAPPAVVEPRAPVAAEATVTPPTTPTEGLAAFPASVAHDVELLLQSDSRETRRTAAEAVLAQPDPTVPPVARALAALEIAEGCTGKRNALREIRTLRDLRAIPAVERLERLPRRGCGMFGLGDCWSCLRGETRRTLSSLQGEASDGDAVESEETAPATPPPTSGRSRRRRRR